MSKKSAILYTLAAMLMLACASIGHPDGGPYDEEPPVLVSSRPLPYELNVSKKRIVLNFDENIKLQNAFEKVVISPPQLEMPQIKADAKRVTVELVDSLIPNTTYSIDFNDAIVDNNEGNPLENFSFVFSTGEQVDTFAVSGTVLNAEDLEPIKGIMVGLYRVGNDSAFYNTPFERVARTDSRGRFSVKGIAPGQYRVYALADANQNYRFDQKSEKIAFTDRIIEPFATPAVRPDTIWRDSVTIDTIRYISYTRFQPDDIVLRAFNEEFYSQYLLKSTRKEHSNFTLFFADRNDSLPKIEGLDFDAKDAFVVEASAKYDTLLYWVKDSAIYNKDTLGISVTYNVLDSVGLLVPRSDTLYLSPRKKLAKILEEEREKFEKEEKEFLKEAKRKKDYDENNPPVYVPKPQFLKVKMLSNSSSDVNVDYMIEFEEPIISIDTSAIHVLKVVNDSVSEPMPFVFRQVDGTVRRYAIYAEWRPEGKYRVEIDSAAFVGLYGDHSNKIEESISFRSLDEYAVLYLTIPETGNDAIVQLMKQNEKIVAWQRTENNRCSFYFIKPDKYYLRLIMDKNANGVWDTGDFAKGLQPDEVYYYPYELELRALFEYSQDDWDINAPLNEQKPLIITKQKPDKERQKRNRNAERKFKK